MTLGERPVARYRELTADELIEISRVPLNFPYNFAEPPRPTLRWGLVDFLDHARFPFARQDPCDKWGVTCLSSDNFLRFLSGEGWTSPGGLSAVTVAKAIAYGLEITEVTASAWPAWRPVPPDSENLLAEVKALGETCLSDHPEISPWRHFFEAAKHPVIRQGLNNALTNRWGVPGCPPAV